MLTPAECAEPAAPECVVDEDTVDVAAPHAPVTTSAAIKLVTGIVFTLDNAYKVRRVGWSNRSAHMNLVAGDQRICRPWRQRIPFNAHSTLIGCKDSCSRQQTNSRLVATRAFDAERIMNAC